MATLTDKSRQAIAEKKRRRCKHFNGTTNATCDAGVNYLELSGGDPHGYACRLPCTEGGCPWAPEEKIVPCALREIMTEDEIQAEIDELDRSFAKSVGARAAITEYLKATGQPSRNVSGNIPCPACEDGTLHFSIAFNGHCHAKCSTDGCVFFME